MKKEFPVDDEWLAYELRPDTPRDGIPLSALFPGIDVKQRYESLNRSAKPYGITFGELTRISNSHLALEAGEYAKDAGKFRDFHERVFRAYFLELMNIGDPDIILRLSKEVGLDPGFLQEALKTGRYAQRLSEARDLALKYSVTAVPTFIIGENHKIVGAQPMDVFREQLRSVESE